MNRVLAQIKRSRLIRFSEGWAAALFLLPSLAGFAVFYAAPFILGIYYSMQDSPVDGSYVGLHNYGELLGNPAFQRAATQSIWFMVVSVPCVTAVSLLLALLLNRSLHMREWLRTAFLTPLVVPAASVVLVWQLLFDRQGAINGWLARYGIEPQAWMNSEWAFWVVVLVFVWKNAGYNMILFLAGLQNIPKVYYEAAAIEGAGVFQLWRFVTNVYLRSTYFIVLVMSIINSFKVFRETYMVAGAYPHESIYMLQHYMNNQFYSLDIQKLTSAAVMMVIAIALFMLAFIRAERRMGEEVG